MFITTISLVLYHGYMFRLILSHHQADNLWLYS